MCEYPDIMIEPVPTFWNEFIVLIDMIKSVCDDDNYNKIFDGYKIMLNKFIIFNNNFMDGKIDGKLNTELKNIIRTSPGSGEPSYDGWYSKLYKNEKDITKYKPIISSMFTGVPDIRGPGGIVHLATGRAQLMYIIVSNKVYIGPVYSSYEFISETKRYNDQEWKTSINNYKNLDFNLY